MNERRARTRPTKEFFVDMLTRDINLADAVLDLVDNAIDAFIRSRDLDLKEALVPAVKGTPGDGHSEGDIDIVLSEDAVEVRDACGGIDIERAEYEVFRIGLPAAQEGPSLGVYGIGLKRAIFKLGSEVVVESRTVDKGFRVAFNVNEWKDDPEDWTLPIEEISPASSEEEAGTRVRVERLRSEVANMVLSNQFLQELTSVISETYALFLDRFIEVTLNGSGVEAEPIRLAESDRIRVARRNFERDGVDVNLLTGLAERVGGSWEQDRAGWYVMCNGRVVVSADKSELTGWGADYAQFVPKYRGFIGVALFTSDDPERLPWTTTKRGLNQESSVYQTARNKMIGVTRPVLRFLDDMYPRDVEEEEEPVERELADDISGQDLRSQIERGESEFTVDRPLSEKKVRKTAVRYKVKESEIDRIKRCMGKSGLSNAEIGRRTFQYYLAHECPDE